MILFAAFIVFVLTVKINMNSIETNYDFVLPYSKQQLGDFFSGEGRVVMDNSYIVHSNVNTKVKNIYFNVGDAVNEGDVLCEFEDENLDDQIQRTSDLIANIEKLNNLRYSQAGEDINYINNIKSLEIEKAKIDLDFAKKKLDDLESKSDEYYQKYCDNLGNNIAEVYYEMHESCVSQINVQRIEVEHCEKNLEYVNSINNGNVQDAEFAKNSLVISSNILADYRNKLSSLQQQKESLIIKAEKPGVVKKVFVNAGEYVINSNIMEIVSDGDYSVELNISSKNILEIRTGMNIVFTTLLTGNKEIKGVIREISEVSDGEGYTVKVDISDKTVMKKLKSDISVVAKIYIQDSIECYAVPYDSIVEENDEEYVFVAKKINDKYIAKKVKVETGIESGYYTEIVSSSLEEGDYILGSGTKYTEGDILLLKGMNE